MPATWRAQALQALANLGMVLEASGSGAPRRRAEEHLGHRRRRLTAGRGPRRWGARLGQAGCRQAATLLGVAHLALPELLIELEVTAVK